MSRFRKAPGMFRRELATGEAGAIQGSPDPWGRWQVSAADGLGSSEPTSHQLWALTFSRTATVQGRNTPLLSLLRSPKQARVFVLLP